MKRKIPIRVQIELALQAAITGLIYSISAALGKPAVYSRIDGVEVLW